jgi:hypothetical protein
MKETTGGLPTPAGAKTAVNISTFSTGSGVPVETEAPVDFAPLANLVTSLYNGNYRSFFVALAAVEDQFLTQDRYLHEHRAWFVREMRLRAYQQLLQSYRVVGLSGMANDFGVTVDYLDRYVLSGTPQIESNLLTTTTGTLPSSFQTTALPAPSIESTVSSRRIDQMTRTSSMPMW